MEQIQKILNIGLEKYNKEHKVIGVLIITTV